MTKQEIIALITVAFLLVSVFMVGFTYEREKTEPIESTRAVVLSCTIKSNIDGVITFNDDCKITVIGEE